MILAFDTYYFDSKAKTVCILFNDWIDEENYKVETEIIDNVEEYQSGEFYKRELPCILSLLDKIELQNVKTIIIDGFVFLDDNNKPGLGGHLYQKLKGQIPVIGVAKANFATLEKNKKQLIRGKSEKYKTTFYNFYWN
jgi:deoxyribonuclease V